MKSHELFREILQKANAKQLAAVMGLSTSMIYKWAEPSEEGGSGTPNPLDRIEQILSVADGEALAQWVCERAGGFFVRNPELNKSEVLPLVAAMNGVVQEFAGMLAGIAAAALDNSICAKEAEDIRARWQRLQSATEEFVCCCEGGTFEKMLERTGQSRE